MQTKLKSLLFLGLLALGCGTGDTATNNGEGQGANNGKGDNTKKITT